MKSSITALLLCLSFQLFAQQFSAKIIDAKTQESIPFATIQNSDTSGVISNEDGIFNINLNGAKTLSFSCMGYESESITVETIKNNNYIVSLKEAVNQLGTVYLNQSKPHTDSIIARALANIPKNYKFNLHKYNLFYRQKNGFNFKKLNFDIDKATGYRKKALQDANNSLDSLSRVITDSKSVHFIDLLGDLSVRTKDTSKLEITKATMLLDKKNNFSVEGVQKKAQAIVFKYLNKEATYKVKTGLFKVEDSLSFEDLKAEEQKTDTTVSTRSMRYSIFDILKSANLQDNTMTKAFLNTDLYDYTFKDITYFNDDLIYIIDFTPDRSKAKYSGTLYITADTYALVKADYSFAKGKRGEKLNLRLLFGIKYINNLHKGTILFQKKNSHYYPRFISEETGQYVYLHRPFKFSENESRNKVKFDVLVEGTVLNRNELLINNTEFIDLQQFNEVNEIKETKYEELQRYKPELWKAYNVLEPLEDMKNFTVE